MNIGNQILNIRKENQLTQEEFGNLLFPWHITKGGFENDTIYG